MHSLIANRGRGKLANAPSGAWCATFVAPQTAGRHRRRQQAWGSTVVVSDAAQCLSREGFRSEVYHCARPRIDAEIAYAQQWSKDAAKRAFRWPPVCMEDMRREIASRLVDAYLNVTHGGLEQFRKERGQLRKRIGGVCGGSDFGDLKGVLEIFTRPWTATRGLFPPVGSQPPRLRAQPDAMAEAERTQQRRHAGKTARVEAPCEPTDVVALLSSGAFVGLAAGWMGAIF